MASIGSLQRWSWRPSISELLMGKPDLIVVEFYLVTYKLDGKSCCKSFDTFIEANRFGSKLGAGFKIHPIKLRF